MRTLKPSLLSVLESLEFGWQAIPYALIFVSAFFRQRASLKTVLTDKKLFIIGDEDDLRELGQK